MLFAELAAVCKARGTTVFQQLTNLYRRFGFFASVQRNATMTGSEGAARIAFLMRELRTRPPAQIAGLAVLERRDYAVRQRIWFDGQHQPLSLPPSDVIAYELEGENRVIVRPSGTEPKLKIYLDRRETVAAGEPVAMAEERAKRELARIDRSLDLLLPGIGT
jgi:phosphomannomutase